MQGKILEAGVNRPMLAVLAKRESLDVIETLDEEVIVDNARPG